MAWISVDQSMIGDRLRILQKEIGCTRNEAIGILVGLWIWGIDNAKEDGSLPSVDLEDIAEQLTVGMDRSLNPMEVTELLIKTGWITEIDGVYRIESWSELIGNYERIVRENRSNSERQAKFRAKKKASGEINVDSNDTSNVTDNVDKKSKSKKASKTDKYGEDFERLWEIYPRKEGKKESFGCYMARIKEGYDPGTILSAVQNYAQICQRERKERQFTLQPKTFLGSNLRFTDYIPKNHTAVEQARQKVETGANPFR